MKENVLVKINKLIEQNRVDEAQSELSKLGPEFLENSEYLYLRSKVFCLFKLYYLAIDMLLVALEFGQNEKIYNLLAEIYGILGNEKLSKKILDLNLRMSSINSLKDEMSGIYRKKI